MNKKDDNIQVANRNFTRLSNNLKNKGYADGKADGQESIFQKSFDQAYAIGFEMGFKLGRCHGTDFALNPNDSKVSTELILNKPSHGHCQICINKPLFNEPIEKIISAQTKHNAAISTILVEKF